ncbi:hypothetical protein OSTOST_02664 [Ostertagia ostertagi]
MELCSDLFKKHVLGEVQAYVYVIEFQKRGLPHCHMLLIMKERWKVRTPEECDRAVTAEIPNPETEPELHAAITSYMIHRRCGPADPQSPDSQNLCVTIHSDEWVVPTNPYLIMKYDCHINMEICGMISAVKYLYKYVYKGPDRANINIEGAGENDEIKQHLNTRYVCAPQSLYRIFGFPLQDRSHTVCICRTFTPSTSRKLNARCAQVFTSGRHFKATPNSQ